MASKISQDLAKISKQMKANFYLKDKPIQAEEIFKEDGLLAAIAKRADQLCQLCMGYGIGVTFEEAEGAITGSRVIFDDVTPNTLRYLCILDVINEMIKGSSSFDKITLDELLYD